MKNTNQPDANTMTNQGLRVFGGLSLIIYLFALSFCYFTNRLMETAIVGAVMLMLVILIFSLYYSTDKQPKKNTHDITSESSLGHRPAGIYDGGH